MKRKKKRRPKPKVLLRFGDYRLVITEDRLFGTIERLDGMDAMNSSVWLSVDSESWSAGYSWIRNEMAKALWDKRVRRHKAISRKKKNGMHS